jgi:hypothetical protein
VVACDDYRTSRVYDDDNGGNNVIRNNWINKKRLQAREPTPLMFCLICTSYSLVLLYKPKTLPQKIQLKPQAISRYNKYKCRYFSTLLI